MPVKNMIKSNKTKRVFIIFTLIYTLLVFIISSMTSLALTIYPTDTSKNEQPFIVVFQLTNNSSAVNSKEQVFKGTNWLYLIKNIQIFNYRDKVSISLNPHKTINIEHLSKIISANLSSRIKISIIKGERQNDASVANNLHLNLVTIILYSGMISILITTTYILFSSIFQNLTRRIKEYIQVFTLKELNKEQDKYLCYGFGLLLISLLMLSFYYFTQPDFRDGFFNSDHMYLPDLFRSISKGASLLNVPINSSPGFLPDFVFFSFAYWLTSNLYYEFWINFIIQISFYFAAIAFVFSTFFNKKTSIYFAGWITFFICTLNVSSFGQTSIYRISLYTSGYHSGAIINFLVLLGLVLKSFGHIKNQIITCLFIFILSFLAGLSEPLTIFWFSAPYALTLLVLYLSNKINFKINFCYWLISSFASFLGIIALSLCFHVNDRGGVHIIPFNSGAILKQIFFALFYVSDLWFVSLLLTFLWIVILIITVFLRRNQRLTHRENVKLNFLLLFFMTSPLIMFIAQFLLQNLTFASRYMFPNFILPLIIFIPFICGVFNDRHLLIMVISILILPISQIKHAKLSLHEYYPPDMKCLDDTLSKYKVNKGIAQYWDARKYTLLSKNKISFYAVEGDTMLPFYRSINMTDLPSGFDFAVIDTDNSANLLPALIINENLIYKINGKPIERLTNCKDRIILIYPKDGVKLNHL